MGIVDQSTSEAIKIKLTQKRVDAVTARKIKEICVKQIEKGIRDIHFDFSDVSYINSSGIGNLLYIRQILKKNSKNLYVDSMTNELKKLFRELLLDNYFVLPG